MTERAEPGVRRPGPWFLPASVLTIIAALGMLDLALDSPPDWWTLHVAVEVATTAFCLGTAAVLWRAWRRSERSLRQVRRMLQDRQSERDEWRTRAQGLLRGLGEAIDSQLEEWQLTPAEKETALHLLKGYSHKESARLCHRSERTVRQHAVAVYRKSGLGGRAELAAFFLEDLLLPPHRGDPGRDGSAGRRAS